MALKIKLCLCHTGEREPGCIRSFRRMSRFRPTGLDEPHVISKERQLEMNQR